MAPADVRQNDRVVYSINGKEYNGVALNNATLGLHPGHKRASYHLNLIYLNESGSPVKVFAAPLLTEAATSAEHGEIAELEHLARSRDHRRSTLRSVKDVDAELQARPVKIGWKPYDPGAELAKTQQALADAQTEVSVLNAKLAAANAEVETLKGQLATVTEAPNEAPVGVNAGAQEVPSLAASDSSSDSGSQADGSADSSEASDQQQ